MNKRRGITLLALLTVLVLMPSVLALSPEEQYGFAQQLKDDGDEVLALLEYQRFAYIYPDHEKAPEALMESVMIRLRVTREAGKAQRTLDRLAKEYPDSEPAQKAKQLGEFVATNSDYQGRPLALYLRSRREADQGDHERAADLFLSVAEQWPEAQISDEALLNAAQLQLRQTDQPQKARETIDTLIERYPKRSTAAEAHYVRAEIVLETEDESQRARAAFRAVMEKYPESPFAEKARRRIENLEKSLIKRTYEERLVQDYRVVKSRHRGDRYEETVELNSEASRKEVLATMEDALIKAIGKRRDEQEGVEIEAYFDYPDKEAGDARWKPGEKPEYEIAERDAKDVLKDTLFDILRGR